MGSMSEREPDAVPDWAEKERADELAWLKESHNLALLWATAQTGYSQSGRGAVVIEDREPLAEMRYYGQELQDELEDEAAQRLVEAYYPERELVVIFGGGEPRCYRVEVGQEASIRAVSIEAGEPRAPEDLSTPSPPDPYQAAKTLFMARVERLQQAGQMLRPSEITSEEEQDDHFDQLARLYRQTCLEMGLAWPPPVLDDEGEQP
jgi:hypothetical protein